MIEYSNQLDRLRFWNRTAIVAFVCALPATFLVGLITSGTVLVRVLPFVTFGLFAVAIVLAYVQIRTFRCPRCSNYFTVKHALGANSRGRNCVHCGLPAYAGAQPGIQAGVHEKP